MMGGLKGEVALFVSEMGNRYPLQLAPQCSAFRKCGTVMP